MLDLIVPVAMKVNLIFPLLTLFLSYFFPLIDILTNGKNRRLITIFPGLVQALFLKASEKCLTVMIRQHRLRINPMKGGMLGSFEVKGKLGFIAFFNHQKLQLP